MIFQHHIKDSQVIGRNNGDTKQTLHFLCLENETFPNNGSLELCILKQAFSPGTANLVEEIEQCFQKNGWPPAWRIDEDLDIKRSNDTY